MYIFTKQATVLYVEKKLRVCHCFRKCGNLGTKFVSTLHLKTV